MIGHNLKTIFLLSPEPRGEPSRFHHGVQGVQQVWSLLFDLLFLFLLFPEAASPDDADTRTLSHLLHHHDRVRRCAAALHHVPARTAAPPSALPPSARHPLGAGPRQLLKLLHLRGLAAHPHAALPPLQRVVRGGQELRACPLPVGRLSAPPATPHGLLRPVSPQLDSGVRQDGHPPRPFAPARRTARNTFA